jgi:hypothetical protein
MYGFCGVHVWPILPALLWHIGWDVQSVGGILVWLIAVGWCVYHSIMTPVWYCGRAEAAQGDRLSRFLTL